MNKHWGKSIFIWTMLLIFISSIPVSMGFLNQNEQWRFSGFVMNIDDGNSYITKMMQGYQGAWLYRAPYSLEPQNGLLVFLPYILLGKLGSSTALHTQLIVLFHIFRVMGIVVMVYGINRFIKLFHLKIEYRLLVLILSTAGGGTGWLILLWGQSNLAGWVPLEFISPEGFGFISAYATPHLSFARGLLFGSIAYFIEGISYWQKNDRHSPYLWLSCATGLLLIGFFQPLYCAIAVLWIVIISLIELSFGGVIHKIRLREVIYVILVCVPAGVWVGYILIMGRVDSFMHEWNTQNIVQSPPIGLLVMSYGLFYLFLVINNNKLRVAINYFPVKFLLVLIILTPLLMYIPFNIQRRLSEGLWLSLLLLIVLSIQEYGKLGKQIILMALSILTVPSTIILLIMGIHAVDNKISPVYVSKESIEVYKSAEKLSNKGNFLTPFRIGNEITAWAPVNVSLGHGPETIYYEKFEKMYQDYVNGRTDPITRLAWSDQYKIKYAIAERSKIDNLNDVDSYGNEVYSSGNLIITEIVP